MENVKIHIEYGKNDLKQLLTELLKEQYINFINKTYFEASK